MKLISIQLPDTKLGSTVEFILLCVLYNIQIAVSACTCWISIFCGKIKVACQNLTAANLTCQYGKHSYSLFVWLKSKSKARYKCVKRRSFVCQQLASNSCRVDCFLYFLMFFFFFWMWMKTAPAHNLAKCFRSKVDNCLSHVYYESWFLWPDVSVCSIIIICWHTWEKVKLWRILLESLWPRAILLHFFFIISSVKIHIIKLLHRHCDLFNSFATWKNQQHSTRFNPYFSAIEYQFSNSIFARPRLHIDTQNTVDIKR